MDTKANKALTFSDFQAACIRTLASTNEAVMGLGIAGEAGEVCEMLKKSIDHGIPIDKDALSKELGDVLFYIAALALIYDIALEDVAAGNIAKLAERYPNGFVKGGGIREQKEDA